MPDNHWLVAMSKYAFRRFQLNGSPIFWPGQDRRPKTEDRRRPKSHPCEAAVRQIRAHATATSSRFEYKNIYIFSSLYLKDQPPLYFVAPTDMPRWRMLCGGVFSFFSDSHYLSTLTLRLWLWLWLLLRVELPTSSHFNIHRWLTMFRFSFRWQPFAPFLAF